MPSIRITDQLNVDILTAEAGAGSGISKYFKGDTAGFLASAELANALLKPIVTIATTPIGLGLSFAKDGTFGTTGVDWCLQAGERIAVSAAQTGSPIQGDKPFTNPVVVGPGKTFVAVSFNPRLSIDLSKTAGDLQFGFSAGGSVEYRAGRFYDITGVIPTLRETLKDLLSTAVVPGDVADLAHMRPGDVASVSGSGQLTFSASFNLAQALNPLATPTLGLEAIGALTLQAGASVTVGASVGVSGRYQLRVFKVDESRIRLGLFKMAGTQMEFDVTASAGLSATLGKRDLTEKVMFFLGAQKADAAALAEAGLSDGQIDDMKSAIEASLSRALALSLSGSFAVSAEDTSIFEYEFDLSRLDTAATEALHRALQADLSPLTSRRSDDMPAGVRMLSSELDKVVKKSITWKINLLGIVNVLRMSTLVRSGKVLFDAETGELLVTDSATAQKILVSANSLAADSGKLRKVMMQSAVLTAAYRASGVQKFLDFKGSISYYEESANAKRQNISDFLDNMVGLLLITDAQKKTFLDQPFAGRASIYVEVTFDRPSFEGMFQDPTGKPWPEEHFYAIGRECVALLVQPGDPNDFRRIPMLPENDRLWEQMTKLGQPSLHTVLSPPLNAGIPLALITHDYTVITWWSAAMKKAGECVADMRAFLRSNGDDAEALKDNNDFKKKRAALESSLASIVQRSQPDFLDAWGVLAMYTAARRRADVRGILFTRGPVLAANRSIVDSLGGDAAKA